MLPDITVALCGAFVIGEGDTGGDHINKSEPPVAKGSREEWDELLSVPENERATNPQPIWMAREHRSMGGEGEGTPDFKVEPLSAVAENCPFVRP